MTDKKSACTKPEMEDMKMPEMEEMEMPEMGMGGHMCPYMSQMMMCPMMMNQMSYFCPMMGPANYNPMEMGEHMHKKEKMRVKDWYEDDDEYSEDYDDHDDHHMYYKHHKHPYYWPPYYPFLPYYPYHKKYHKYQQYIF